MAEIIRERLQFYGRVQGVGFRYRAEHAAQSLRLTGWVRNEADGSVLMEVQGPKEQITQMLIMIRQSTYIDITDMNSKVVPIIEDDRGFYTKESVGDFFGFWHKE